MEILNYGGVPIHLWADAGAVEAQALQQLGNISRLPVVADHIAVMPDAHLSKGATVGSVIPTRGAVVPASVGVDIGCFHGDMKVSLLDGTQATFEQLETSTEPFWVYSIDRGGKISPGLARCVKTRRDAALIRVVVSGGDEIICTPDHEFMLSDGTYRQAKDLIFNDSLMPLYRRWQTRDGYESASNGKGSARLTHVMVWEAINGAMPDGHVVHHKNHIHFDNRPENLELMTVGHHSAYHRAVGRKFDNSDPAFQVARRMGISRRRSDPKQRRKMAEVGTENITRYMRENPEHFARSVEKNGERGSPYLRKFNTSPRTCSDCGEEMANPAALRWHKNAEHGYNHKVLMVQALEKCADVYCLQVEEYHNFALAAGVFVHNCGMMAARLSLTADDLPESLAQVRAQIERDIPVGQAMHGGGRMPRLVESAAAQVETGLLRVLEDAPGLLDRRRDKHAWAAQIGTLGKGNHFIELCLDHDEQVWVMLHSGSRGIGHAIGTHYISKARARAEREGIFLEDRDLAWLPEGTPEFDAYWRALSWAQNYAAINRRVMFGLLIDALSRHLPAFTIEDAVINCHHNYVARETHGGQEVYITRKGAIRADVGRMGIIPGTMGTASYIVRGKGNKDSFCSCSHGAGRVMSRSEAKRHFSEADVAAQTAGVECRKDSGVIDELPGAYKDIDKVMAQQSDLVDIVHTLKQVLCVKG